MFPNVNANDGDMRKQRVLISGCDNCQSLVLGINTLTVNDE
jgi:hypothetical protein